MDDPGVSMVAPNNWGRLPPPPNGLVGLIDSTSRDVFKTNLVVSYYTNLSVAKYVEVKQVEMSKADRWTLIEDKENPYFWAKNAYTSYITREVRDSVETGIGLWCFAFEVDSSTIEVSLAGLTRDTERLDYLFKFITARIEKVPGPEER